MAAKSRAKKAGRTGDDRKNLAKFFIRLSRDPRMRESFRHDPDDVMAKAGLTETHKTLIRQGDPKKIRKHLGSDGPPGCFFLVIVRKPPGNH